MRSGRGTKGIPKRRRRSVSTASQKDWVDIRPLFADRPFPVLVTPRIPGLGLGEWTENNRAFVQALWEEKRALLFRDFDLGGIPGFEQFVDLTGGPRLPYVDRSTPREEYGNNVYCTTIYPSEYRIRLHNEGSYWTVHPQKAYFCCITPSTTGGETPIGDVHAVYDRIDPALRDEFVKRKRMLVRNYNDGFGLPWQEVFQTTDRTEVEAYCHANRIEVEWREGDLLRTRQIREAVFDHPRTGEPVWHNHIAFFHLTTREAGIREALLADYDEIDLPYQTFYGDGEPIDPDVIRHFNEAYDAELVKFTWQAGDVHWIDNIRLAHAREAYTGDRLVLVALTDAFEPPAA